MRTANRAGVASAPAHSLSTLPSHEPNAAAGSFAIRQSGNIGQEILDADGRILAWTTDPWVAQVVVKLLNDNEGLLR